MIISRFNHLTELEKAGFTDNSGVLVRPVPFDLITDKNIGLSVSLLWQWDKNDKIYHVEKWANIQTAFENPDCNWKINICYDCILYRFSAGCCSWGFFTDHQLTDFNLLDSWQCDKYKDIKKAVKTLKRTDIGDLIIYVFKYNFCAIQSAIFCPSHWY